MIMLSHVANETLHRPSAIVFRPLRGDKPTTMLLEFKKTRGNKDSKKISRKHLEKIQRRKDRIERKGEKGLPRPSRFSI